MKNLLVAIIALTVMVGDLGVAQALPHACPPGFFELGLQKSSNTMINNEAKVAFEAKYFDVPAGYHVISGLGSGPYDASGGSADFRTNMPWPNGIAVFGYGEEDSNNCKGWTYTVPVFISNDKLQIKLYCHSGSNFICQRGINSCYVYVRVCAKLE